ncbi:TolC family protein [Mucilaginibacter sp. KACC 22773]|uniref:TolC family protein n=1 Tax=Mucilaginibacter sp. KACC 22773 TaxID=3025671 RepID=UPI0023664920|nr:TolC family protein [Mucilaginibacter sp. KACC 22773]WDF79587.1 TolC family protein [Mucilaginibacter sp. KACC 22773]
MKYPDLPALPKISVLAGVLLCFLFPRQTLGQQSKPYLDSLLHTATANYPLIKAKRLQTQSLQYAVKYKQNGIIPLLNASYQVDYATANNITGMVYPQFITPISGPPSKGNDYSGVPGSAAALNLQWEPITFGQRRAEVDLAKGRLKYGQADENLTLFQHQVNVIGAWLNYLLVSELIKVYRSNIDRAAFNLKQAQTLVISGLRPGTDSSSFQSEYTRAQMQLITFERQQDSTLIALKELVGGTLPAGLVVDTSLFKTLPVIALSDTITTSHPEVQLGQANLNANELALKSLKRSILPKLTLWSTGYGRGSGIAADGSVNSGDGWRFQRYNYGVGAQIAFPILEVFRHEPVWKQQELITASSREQLLQTELHLNTQKEIAASNFKRALQSAQLAPQQLHSAEYTYKGIQSRYKSGLINYYDVIQAQQLLFQSAATVSIAYYSTWRALLSEAAYSGNLNLFLNQYGK